MNFKEWLIKEKTLYHGTLVDYKSDILKYGLVPGWHNDGPGDFVSHFYDDYMPNDYELGIFLADKASIQKAINAMEFHIAKKLKKDYHQVTDLDVRNHGMLVIVKDEDNSYKPYSSQDYEARHNVLGAEDGDYISDGERADYVLHGSNLLRFLHKMNIGDFGDNNSTKNKNKLAGKAYAKELSNLPLFKWAKISN